MINIRYHIVSITAVFLALGIGAALGGTFLDRYTVNRIDTNVRSAEARIKETRAENSDLSDEVDQARERDQRLLQNAGPQLFGGHLEDVPVLLLTAPGIDQTTADVVRTALVAANADLRGTIELQDAMAFDETDSIDDGLATALGVRANDPARARRVAYREMQQALADAGERPAAGDLVPGGPTPPTQPGETTLPGGTAVPGQTTTVPGATTTLDPGTTTTIETSGEAAVTEQPAVLTALLAADYLRLTPGPGHTADEPLLASTGYRYVVVSGPTMDPAASSRLVNVLPGPRDGVAVSAVLVSPSVPEPEAGVLPTSTAVSLVRSSTTMAARYSTVDDIEDFSGQSAMVLALELVDSIAPAHYGQGEGATAIVPTAP